MRAHMKTFSVAAAAVLGGGLAFGSVALASPGSGNTVQTDVATGELVGKGHSRNIIAQDGVKLLTPRNAKVTTFDLTYPPGSFSGWHSHPGIVIAVVKQGAVVRRTACKRQTFKAGQSFTEVGPHHVSNPGTGDAVLSITRIYPSNRTEARLEESAPHC